MHASQEQQQEQEQRLQAKGTAVHAGGDSVCVHPVISAATCMTSHEHRLFAPLHSLPFAVRLSLSLSRPRSLHLDNDFIVTRETVTERTDRQTGEADSQEEEDEGEREKLAKQMITGSLTRLSLSSPEMPAQICDRATSSSLFW